MSKNQKSVWYNIFVNFEKARTLIGSKNGSKGELMAGQSWTPFQWFLASISAITATGFTWIILVVWFSIFNQ